MGTDTLAQSQSTLSVLLPTVVAATAALLSLVAVMVTLRQIRQTTSREATRSSAFIVAFLDTSGGVSPHFHDLVIRNFGESLALNVEVSISPPPYRSASKSRSDGDSDLVKYPSHIPLLAPGQEWRTFWDYSPDRAESDLPMLYKAHVEYSDREGRHHEYDFSIDWATNSERQWVTQYGIHDVAKALREIERQMRNWRQAGSNGLQVVVRDGDKRDERRRQEYRDRLAEKELGRPASDDLNGNDKEE